MMNIRSANHYDLPAIAALQAESWRDTYSDVLPEVYLSQQLTADLKRHWCELKIKTEDVVLVAEIAEFAEEIKKINEMHMPDIRPAKTPASALLKPAMHGEALKAVEVMSLKERNLETIN